MKDKNEWPSLPDSARQAFQAHPQLEMPPDFNQVLLARLSATINAVPTPLEKLIQSMTSPLGSSIGGVFTALILWMLLAPGLSPVHKVVPKKSAPPIPAIDVGLLQESDFPRSFQP